MLVKGLPDKFWLVVSPLPNSTLNDICFDCDFRRFALQIAGGLDEETIVAVFAEQQPAVELAERLLRAAEEPRKPLGVCIHESPWPEWFATQESLEGVMICNKLTSEKVLVEPPKEWGRNWAWNFVEDGSGIVIRQTA